MTNYPVNNIYTCIQGEGVQTGVAMVLVRLHGCAVGCPWCDTKETWAFAPADERPTLPEVMGQNGRFTWADSATIAAYIAQHHPGPRWVLLTGGEPADYRLDTLVKTLHEKGYQVAIETSGTALGHVTAACDWVCVSPKIGMPGGKQVLAEAVASADEIKHVVGKAADIDQLDHLIATMPLKHTAVICLQPISQSRKATDLCIETVQSRGWRLSIQMHKYIGVE